MIGQLEFGMLKTAKRNWFAIKWHQNIICKHK
jgi:hypothetical protein